MSDAARAAVLAELCRELRLPTVLREHDGLARQAADAGWPYEDYLREALSAEVRTRRDRAAVRRIRDARFPDTKTLDQLDFDDLKGIKRPKLLELAACDYIEQANDVVIAGPIGTGKTHIAIALGVEAARRRYRVRFTRAADLVCELREAKDEHILGKLHDRYRKVHLLIIDELGFVPFDRVGGELLFNLLADRYERRSTIITTNLSFGEWVQVFGSEKLTTALLDRLSHHAHIMTTKGVSYRTKKLRQ